MYSALSLFCQFYVDLRLLITPLVSANFYRTEHTFQINAYLQHAYILQADNLITQSAIHVHKTDTKLYNYDYI